MHLLVLSHEFGFSASGVMTKRIARELARQGHDVTVVTSSHCDDNEERMEIVECPNLISMDSFFYRVPKYLYRILFKDGTDYHFIWRRRALKICRKIIRTQKIDWIYCRSTPLDPCVVGDRLHMESGIPVLQHFADPLPNHYLTQNKLILHSLKRKVRKIMDHASLISFGNHEMMQFQLSFLNCQEKSSGRVFVSYDVAESSLPLVLPVREKDIYRFVFLGTFGNYRDPYPLFRTIDRLNSEQVKCELYVYSPISKTNFYVSENVHFCGRTNDVVAAMSDADALIDLDVKDEKSVFISSKIKDYLRTNRPIIAITRTGSPTSYLLNGITSAVTAANNEDSLYRVLKKIVTDRETPDTGDRSQLLETFSPRTVAADLISRLISRQNA